MDYDTMEAGRDMDRLVAEKVFGWEWYVDRDGTGYPIDQYGVAVQESGKAEYHGKVWSPSTDIEHAWDVLKRWTVSAIRDGMVSEVASAREWYLAYACTHDEFNCELNESGSIIGHARARTAPLAICRAALKAVS